MLMWLCWQLKELADKRVNKKWLIRGGKEWAKLSYPTPLCSLVHPTGLPRPNQALAQISCRCTYRRQIKDKNWDGVVKHTGASIQEARGSMTSLIGRKLTLIVWRGFHNHWISYTILPCGRMVFWHISLTMEHWSHFGGFWWVHTLCDTLVMVFLFFISLINTRDSSFTTQWLMITLNNCFVCHRLAAPYPEKLQVTEAPQEQLLKMGLEKKDLCSSKDMRSGLMRKVVCPFYLVVWHRSSSGDMLFMRMAISCPCSVPHLSPPPSSHLWVPSPPHYTTDKQSLWLTLPSWILCPCLATETHTHTHQPVNS